MLGILVAVIVGAWAALAQQVVDQSGREVSLPEAATRVASVYGVATPYFYASGAADLLVGARYLGLPDSPVGVSVMRRIDPNFELKAFPGEVGVETILALQANLVLLGPRHRELGAQLGDVGIASVVYAPETPQLIKEAIFLTGKLLGREDHARELWAFGETILQAAEKTAEALVLEARPRVMFVGTNPLRVPGKEMYQTHLIALAGGLSVSQDLRGSWQTISPEQILAWDPEVIVIAPYGPVQPETFASDPVFSSLTAVRTGRVFKMPQILFSWDTPIPESALGILWLAELLHPGRIGLDLVEMISTFYRRFYGVDLAEEELNIVRRFP